MAGIFTSPSNNCSPCTISGQAACQLVSVCLGFSQKSASCQFKEITEELVGWLQRSERNKSPYECCRKDRRPKRRISIISDRRYATLLGCLFQYLLTPRTCSSHDREADLVSLLHWKDSLTRFTNVLTFRFDQMVAVLTGKRQRFPSVEYFVSRPITRSTNDQIRHHGSPLSFSGDFDDVLTYHKSQAALRSCLKHVWTLTQNLECQTPSNSPHAPEQFHDPIPFIEESRHSYKTSLLTLPLVSACYAPCHNHVLETIQHSSTLYSRTLTTPGLDFPSPPNEHSYKELYRAFAKCSHDDLWVRFPGVLLWVLLVGTAAARGKEEAAFWMFYLARTGSFSNADGWLMEGAAIRRFLEIQRLMREASSATHVS